MTTYKQIPCRVRELHLTEDKKSMKLMFHKDYYEVDCCCCCCYCYYYYYTVSQKRPTGKLSVTLSNLNRFSKFLHCWKVYKIRYKPVQNYPPHLVMSLHYLGKLEIHIFCRYSADMEENANKWHFKCTNF